MVDVSEHVDLVEKVVRRMNLPTYLQDEAISEGYVILTEAGQKYNPDQGPIGPWLRLMLRYGILNWQRREFKQRSGELAPTVGAFPDMDASVFLHETIQAAESCLTATERTALFGGALGIPSAALSKALHLSGPQLKATRLAARAKLSTQLSYA